MKKFLKCFCVGMLSVLTVSLSGCILAFDPDEPTSGIKSISGFKVCYSDNNYQLDDTFERYSAHVLTNLANVFGVPNIEAQIKSQPLSGNAKNYDRIRVQYTSGPAISTSWKWTFAQNFSSVVSQQQESSVVAYYTTDKAEAYIEEYVKIYKNALAVVFMQIALGQTPQTFVVEVNETTGKTTVFEDAAKTKAVDSAFLQAQKDIFQQKGQYVGFTADNLSTFKNYVLANVIGSSIVGTVYDNVVTTEGAKTYSALLDEICALETDLEKSFLSPYPMCTAKDVVDTSMYPDMSERNNTLKNITPYEYQSLILMPNKSTEILALGMVLSAEVSMTINVCVYYFNAQTKAQSVLHETTVTLSPNKEVECWAPFEDVVVMDKFDNAGTALSTPTQIKNQNGSSRQFAYRDGAVLEEKEKSYLSIVFKPDGAEQSYMPFKVALGSLFIGE